MAKPVGARPRQEVQKCQGDRSGEDDFAASHEAHKFFHKYAVVWAAEANFAGSHEVHKFFDKYAAVWAAETNFAGRCEAHKVFDKYLQYDYVKTVQATSGVPRFLKPVCLEERGAPASTRAAETLRQRMSELGNAGLPYFDISDKNEMPKVFKTVNHSASDSAPPTNRRAMNANIKINRQLRMHECTA